MSLKNIQELSSNVPVASASIPNVESHLLVKGRDYDPWKDIFLNGEFKSPKAMKLKMKIKSNPQIEMSKRRRTKVSSSEKVSKKLTNKSKMDRNGYSFASYDDYYDNHYNSKPSFEDYYYYDDLTDWDRDGDKETKSSKSGKSNRRRQQYDYDDPFYDTRYEDFPQALLPSSQNNRPSNSYPSQDSSSSSSLGSTSITRRISNLIFGTGAESASLFATLVTVLGIPLVLGLAYWLFVVNGPTPVVRARHDENQEHLPDVLEIAKILLETFYKNMDNAN